MNETRSITTAESQKRKRSKGFYVLGGVLLVGIVISLGAWRPAVDLWNTATMDRGQLWGNVWVDNEKWATQDERRERPGELSSVKLDGFPVSLSIRDANMTQCWRGNGEVIASVDTVAPTGGLPAGNLQITVTPDEWPKDIPAEKQEQQLNRTHVPAETTGHAALNFTSTDGEVRYYGQLANARIQGDVVTYKDNKWTIRADFFSPVNSTATISRLEATITCPSGR